jgi:hypothetical protein
VIGADGKFNALGKDWRYDAYFTHGQNTTNIHVRDILLMPRYRAAIQATTVGGQIVCADPIARANGCVPINIFGGKPPSEAALAYITPKNGPYQHSVQKQDVASINFSGEPFSLWAGPVSLAIRRRVAQGAVPRPRRPLRRRQYGLAQHHRLPGRSGPDSRRAPTGSRATTTPAPASTR